MGCSALNPALKEEDQFSKPQTLLRLHSLSFASFLKKISDALIQNQYYQYEKLNRVLSTTEFGKQVTNENSIANRFIRALATDKFQIPKNSMVAVGLLYTDGTLFQKIEGMWGCYEEYKQGEVSQEEIENLFKECFRVAGVVIPAIEEEKEIEEFYNDKKEAITLMAGDLVAQIFFKNNTLRSNEFRVAMKWSNSYFINSVRIRQNLRMANLPKSLVLDS